MTRKTTALAPPPSKPGGKGREEESVFPLRKWYASQRRPFLLGECRVEQPARHGPKSLSYGEKVPPEKRREMLVACKRQKEERGEV